MHDLLARAKEIAQTYIDYRRDFHQHPELGMQEFRTSGIVAAYLQSLGLEVTTGVANTGVVGVLRGEKPGKTIGIRADMDALPIVEQSGAPYASLNEGKMHACGHDGHTAILMGTARLLSEIKQELCGTVKFIFQPAEEGPGGAKPMIEAGVMENPKVDAILGLHLNTTAGPVGQIGLGVGPRTAGTGFVEIKIKGYGGHGAHPESSIDAITAAGHVIVALQTIVSREIDPLGSVVVTLGTIKGGYRHNVIADEVVMTGTVRTLDDKIRASMPERIERIVKGVCDSMRCKYELIYRHGVPSVVNDEKITAMVQRVSEQILGKDNVFEVKNASMGGEDFCYFSQAAPACFFRLYARNEETGCLYPGHHPKYNFDDNAIPYGMAVFAESVVEYLNGDSER